MSDQQDNGQDAKPQAGSKLTPEERRGALAALFCYVLWGLLPIYWKLLAEVDSFEIIAHRIIWCFVITALVCAAGHLGLGKLLRERRAWRYLGPASLFIGINWGIYIYAVNTGHVVETAIGYYINPLVSILLGVVVFRERLTKLQLIAVALCVFGVAFFTINYGQFPWISLALAFSFGIYGAIKKKGGYPAIPAIAFESTVLLVPSIALAVGLAVVTGQHAFASNLDTAHGWYLTILLVVSGAVTAVPLILFAKAANSIPLSLLGFIQYVSPTLALLTGVFLFGEPFTLAHAVCLGSIWCGLALVSFETIRQGK